MRQVYVYFKDMESNMTIQEDRFILFPARKFSFVKLSDVVALFAAATLWCAVCQADIVMSLTKISTEQDVFTNVPNSSSVKYAINYGGVAVDGPIDGVTFVNQGGSSYYTSFNGYNTPQQSFTSRNQSGLLNQASDSYSGSGITQLDKLLSTMVYNNNEPQHGETAITFGNLEAGKTYTARILTRSWDTTTSQRQHAFSIDLNADGVREEFTYGGNQATSQVVSEDQPFSGESYTGAYAVDYTFTAQSNTASIFLRYDGTTNHAWHNYGLMLIETSANQVKPTTPTIYNGSFEADKWVLEGNADNGHGYLDRTGNTGVISGWQFTNLTNSTVSAGLAWVGGPCQDFLGNQTPPNGNQLAWLQGNNNMDVRLYQNVYGFNPADKDTVYRVSMDLGTRGTNKPSFSLYIGEDQATEKAYISSKEVPSGKFTTYGAVFVPNADTQTIAIGNKTSGDNTLLIDNVQLQAYELTTFFSDNYHVKANATGSNIGGPTSNDEPDRFGGLLGAMSYKVSGASNQMQVGNGDYSGKCKESLFFAVKNDQSQSHVSPDYNFANFGTLSVAEEGGRMFDISFRVAPQFDEATNSTNWAAVLFGLSEGSRTANVNSGDGVGILFRRNGGIQIFDRNSCIVDKPAGTFTLTDDWADVRVVYFVPDFNGASPVEANLYVNDKFIASFQTSKGFTNNFIQLEAYTADGGYKRSLIDDFVVRSSAKYIYDASSALFDMSKDWTLNGKDKQGATFLSPREESSVATHTGTITIDGKTYIDVADNLVLQHIGVFDGAGEIVKNGNGVLQINTEGCAAPDPAKSVSFVVNSGELDFKGYFQGSVQVEENAVFSPGNSIGTVTIANDFVLESGATLLMEIGTTNAEGNDQLFVNGDVIFNSGSIVNFALDPTTGYTPQNNEIIAVNMPEVNWDSAVFSSYYFTYKGYENGQVLLGVNPNAVPEPSTWALLILGVSVLLLRKRS